MDTRSYTDFSIVSAKFITKYTGIWLPQNVTEERQRKISATYTAGALLYGIYLHVVDIYNSWGDATRCMYLTMNMMCIGMSTIKMLILNFNRAKLTDAFFYAERHFWHCKYTPEERLIFAVSVKYCTRYAIFAIAFLHLSLSGYVVTPIVENLGRNKSDRVLPFKMWVDWPLSETPYFELMFTFQVISAYVIGISYISPEMFLCVFNLHVMGQFRILQYRILNFWNVESKEMNAIMYTDHCYAALKKCVQHHQLIIEFCMKLEQIYTMTIFVHVAILSLLMGLDCYEIIVADTSRSMLLTFVFHVIGSLIHLCFLTYTCHFMIEESTNITTTVYSGLWCTLPMNKVGRSIRSDMKFIMIRSLKPCCLTAGGFFPVSLETFTALLSSTFSYFTLMRESMMRTEGE
ncbi:odorant receptor 4-like isoform X1 [Osmia bicornis bicornis]|uniref:odorant receptor 4-like isoform X1 n=1 Tax=Osmia bicornis bicornis TaxID=1437191 RepID=UPI001EAED4E3|nr:odorant receptor 4-like isoform X1 [Osmia bicornis bicornis]